MSPKRASTPQWDAEDLHRNKDWIFELTAQERLDLESGVKRAVDRQKTLLQYERKDFPFVAGLQRIAAAVREVGNGRGIALVRGLPRDGLTEKEFELLTWGIGLHFGVARPQGRNSQYISQVKNVGTDYRSATGRGYSSNAELDYHTDTADQVFLTCYNAARKGGMSICASSVAVHNRIAAERPDLVEMLFGTYCFSTQGEQPRGWPPFTTTPIFSIEEGNFYCRWVRNRLETAQKLPDVPPLTDEQRSAVDYLDRVARREELAFTMCLEPGDMQILKSHVTLHSRTEFEDYEEADRRRTLYRLWIAPPDSKRLPASWASPYKSIEAGSVRGGIHGQRYDAQCEAFEQRQAREMGMRWSPVLDVSHPAAMEIP